VNFLALIYLAGISAIALPILFHLIRRAPKGRIQFSSLMFLRTSPPRVTRRSRIENWPLLLLRALAVILLALAFARPFLDRAATTAVDGSQATRKVVLLDTSASMRRGDLWQKAQDTLKDVLDQASPVDRISVMSYDTKTTTILGFEGWSEAATAQRGVLVRGQIKSMKIAPGWAATNTAGALIRAVEAIEEDEARHKSEAPPAKQIILISDLQQGSHFEALSTYEWPKDVQLQVQSVRHDKPSNATLEVLPTPDDGDARLRSGATVRVRVSNAPDSQLDHFKLRWAKADATPVAENKDPNADDAPKSEASDAPNKNADQKNKKNPTDKKQGEDKKKQPSKVAPAGAPTPDAPGLSVDIHVPPGESRDVQLARPGNAYVALVLEGDDHTFDNRAYSVFPPPRRMTVLYLGADSADNPDQPLYYLHRAFTDTPQRIVRFLEHQPDKPLPDIPNDLVLVVVTDVLTEPNSAKVASLLAKGATVLTVVRRNEMDKTLEALTGLKNLDLTEADVGEYAMLGRIDFEHDLFAPFVEPKFRDFTNIRFWKYRRLSSEPAISSLKNINVLMSFDSGDPALIEAKVGRGTCYVLTSGWHPDDSQFSRLASKFLPIMNRIIEVGAGLPPQQPTYYVGTPVRIGDLMDLSDKALGDLRITRPGKADSIDWPTDRSTFQDADRPGIYSVVSLKAQQQFAVNLDPAESDIRPADTELLAKMKVQLSGKPVDKQAQDEKERQLLSHELEQKHKIWRILVIASLAVLIVETWLAGFLADAAPKPFRKEPPHDGSTTSRQIATSHRPVSNPATVAKPRCRLVPPGTCHHHRGGAVDRR